MPLARRLPKRGFNNRNRKEYAPVNVSALDRFDEGSEVSLEQLSAVGLINGPCKLIKILGAGELTKKLTVKAHAFTHSAPQQDRSRWWIL